MTFKINPISDTPTEKAKLLGHDKIVKNLINFLELPNLITPLTIAINGDWGSGKTSIMKTLFANLDDSKFDTLFFEAWKYEYSNPSLGLIAKISSKYEKDEGKIRAIVHTGATILANKFLNIDLEKIIDIITSREKDSQTLTDMLEELIKKNIDDKKLIIVIDDLDRCDVENTLQLLALVKLFLNIPECICITAVDFKRLRQAWLQKYQVKDDESEKAGVDYLDKIFHVKIGIPRPPAQQIEDYLKPMVPGMPKPLLELFSKLGPKNPRAIKRIMNLISYRSIMLPSAHKAESAFLWTLLEEILGNSLTIQVHDVSKREGKTLGDVMYSLADNIRDVKDFYEKRINQKILAPKLGALLLYFEHANIFVKSGKISYQKINKNFETLYELTNEAIK